MEISLKANFPQVQAKLRTLQADLASTVAARAVNRTIDQAKTAMSKEIRAEFNVSAGYVRQRLHVTRASAKGGQLRITATLRGGDGKRRSANVIAFAARQTAQGVSVKIKRAGSRQTIKGAFVANKGRTVFQREGKARLPIKPVRTIDVPQMFNTRRINAAVVRTMQQKFPVIFERELAFALSKWGKR